MAVEGALRGQGIGRKLLLHALDVFRQNQLTIARIETLSDNAIGAHLYPSAGFELVTTQNHYAMRLE
jgi:ribosomal protein S18 acetylase RimI-like enzyme